MHEMVLQNLFTLLFFPCWRNILGGSIEPFDLPFSESITKADRSSLHVKFSSSNGWPYTLLELYPCNRYSRMEDYFTDHIALKKICYGKASGKDIRKKLCSTCTEYYRLLFYHRTMQLNMSNMSTQIFSKKYWETLNGFL